MPWEEDRHERTEKATPRRREKAREKGQVARSKEVGSVAILLTGLVIFHFFGQQAIESLKEITRGLLASSGTVYPTLDDGEIYTLLKRDLMGISSALVPLLFFPLMGIVANVMQVGLLFTPEPLLPNLMRINPLEGLKRLLSAASVVELIKGVLKLIIVGYIAYIYLRKEMGRLCLLPELELTGIISYLGHLIFSLMLMLSLALIIIAVLDYIFQRWEMERNLRMTKQEVKEEFKETEGQPLIRSRIRSLQRQLARQRMMQEVPKATVVITNPEHIAIALRYEQGKMPAPVVIAKGAGLLAEKIKEIAREHGIPVIENKALAQLLWKTVEIGKEIPVTLYRAVAEILAYVYRLKVRR